MIWLLVSLLTSAKYYLLGYFLLPFFLFSFLLTIVISPANLIPAIFFFGVLILIYSRKRRDWLLVGGLLILLPPIYLLGSTSYHHSDRYIRQRINGDLAFAGLPVIPGSARILEFHREYVKEGLGTSRVTFKAALSPYDFRVWHELEGLEEYAIPPIESYMTPAKPKPKTNVIHKQNRGYICHFTVDDQAGTVEGSITTWPVLSL